MIKTMVAVATVAAILAGGEGCNGGDTSPGGGYEHSDQWPVITHRQEHQGFGVVNYQLLIGYPKGKGGPQWTTVTKKEYDQCSDHELYPKCAE